MHHLAHRLGTIIPIFIILMTFSCVTTINEEPDRPYTKKERELIDIRQDIHRHPEISGLEERTSSLVAEYLRKQGLEVQTGVGGYGVVGILKNPAPEVIFGLHCTNFEVGQMLCIEWPALPGVHLMNITLKSRNNLESAERSLHRFIRKINKMDKKIKFPNSSVDVLVAQVDKNPDEAQWILECAVFISNDDNFTEAKKQIGKLLANMAFQSIEVEDFNITPGVPAMVNDVNLMRSTYHVMQSILGEENIIIWEQMPKNSSGGGFFLLSETYSRCIFFSRGIQQEQRIRRNASYRPVCRGRRSHFYWCRGDEKHPAQLPADTLMHPPAHPPYPTILLY